MSYPPQGGYGGGSTGAPPKNNMALSVIATVVGFLFCCPAIITGILSIVNANKVQSLWSAGDHNGANKAAADARKFATITFVLAAIGLVINVIYFVSVAGSST